MGRNTPKRHHYIPLMLLENFCDESGRVWVSDGTKTYPTNPKNVFVQAHLYTRSVFGDSHEDASHEDFLSAIQKSSEYEDHLSEIESRAAPAVQQIIDQVRQGKCPQLPIELRDAWKRFLISIARRTPESQDRVSSLTGHVDAFYDASEHVANLNTYPLPDREALYQDDRVLRLKSMVMANVNARFAAGDDPHIEIETQKFSRETGLSFVVIRLPRKSFVIGSHGLTMVDRKIPGNLTAISWLPIAYDIAVGATALPDRELLSFLDSSNGGERVISLMNRATAAMSRTIVGQSEALVRSLKKV